MILSFKIPVVKKIFNEGDKSWYVEISLDGKILVRMPVKIQRQITSGLCS